MQATPPSEERVEANKKRALEFARGGRLGRDDYRRVTARIRKTKAAYVAYEKGEKALKEKRYLEAQQLANRALTIEANEALFTALKGDILLAQNKNRSALSYYKKAIQQNGHFFAFYLQQGVAQYALGLQKQAAQSLEKSNRLLPTPPAHYYLGEIALKANNNRSAIQHFKVASSVKSAIGIKAAKQLVRLELPIEPGKYIASRVSWSEAGGVTLQLQNHSPLNVQVKGIVLRLVRSGAVVGELDFPLNITLEAGKTRQVLTELNIPKAKNERLLSQVVKAQLL